VPSPNHSGRPRIGIVLIGAALFLWPTIPNWHPYLFWDTYGYFLQGKAYVHLAMAGVGVLPEPPEVAEGWVGAAGRMLARDPSIRSPTWSLLTYICAIAGGFWLLAAINALVAAATVELAMLRLFALEPAARVLVLAGLAAFTALPWFASYLMPDLYAGLMILAAMLLCFAWETMRGIERLLALALYLAALTFHTSHLLLGVLLVFLAAGLSAPWPVRRGRLLRLSLSVSAAAVLLLAGGWLAFGETSLTPRSPPFLLARSWEDGPARSYLTAVCPAAGWAICRHIDSLAPTAQEFLWRSEDSYWGMDLATRAAMRREQIAIVVRAIAADPLRQLGAGLANTVRQAFSLGLDDFVLGRGAAVTPTDYTFVYLPLAPAATLGLGGFSAVLYASTALAVVTLAALWRRGRLSPGDRRLVLFALAALLLNAAICGALSGPFPRYQARVVWLLPLLAAALALRPGGWISRGRVEPAPGGL